jgi:hypothetical protein
MTNEELEAIIRGGATVTDEGVQELATEVERLRAEVKSLRALMIDAGFAYTRGGVVETWGDAGLVRMCQIGALAQAEVERLRSEIIGLRAALEIAVQP